MDVAADFSKPYEVKITGITHDGAGVGRIDGQVVFVPGALQGEEVLIEITGIQKKILYARITEILSYHEDRISPICSVYSSCGGCQLQHAAYPAQLRIKEQQVREALERIGGFTGIKVNPTLGMDEPWGYRNKGHFQVRKQNDRIVLGFYEEGSHQLAGQACRHLFSAQVTSLLAFLEERLTVHNVKTAIIPEQGLCRIMIRESKATGDILLVFVSTGTTIGKIETISREICHEFPQVVGISLSRNARRIGPVLGQDTVVISGKGEITDCLGPFSFAISVPSFFQVNNVQAEVLYQKTVEYAGLTADNTVIDAYCGIGAISLFLAEKAGHVIGIESVIEAVDDAKRNAEENSVKNVEFIEGEAEKVMPRLVEQGICPDVVVVDPPRRGCDKALLDSIIDAKPSRIVYVSCNPATLARDLRMLSAGGYRVEEVQPVDMFPQTAHVEVVTLLTRSVETK